MPEQLLKRNLLGKRIKLSLDQKRACIILKLMNIMGKVTKKCECLKTKENFVT